MTQDILTLKQDVANILSNSPSHVNFWLTNFLEPIEYMTDEYEVLMRVNLFWNVYLAKSDKDLFGVRQYLSDDISIQEWKKRFASKVAPSIIRHIET